MLPSSRTTTQPGQPRRKQIFQNDDAYVNAVPQQGLGRGRLNRMDQSSTVGLQPAPRGSGRIPLNTTASEPSTGQTFTPRQRSQMSQLSGGYQPLGGGDSNGPRIRRQAVPSGTGALPPSGKYQPSYGVPPPKNMQRVPNFQSSAGISGTQSQSFPRAGSRGKVDQPPPVDRTPSSSSSSSSSSIRATNQPPPVSKGLSSSSSIRATNQPPPVSKGLSSSSSIRATNQPPPVSEVLSSRASNRRPVVSKGVVARTSTALPSAVTQSRKQVSGPTPAVSRMLVSKTSLEESNEMDKLVYQLIVNHIRGDTAIYTNPMAEFESIKEDMKNKLTGWSDLPEDERNISWDYSLDKQNVEDMLDIYTTIDEDDERSELVELILRKCMSVRDTRECDILPHLKDKSIEWIRWLIALSNRDFYDQIDRMNKDKTFNRTIPVPPKPTTPTSKSVVPRIPYKPSNSQIVVKNEEPEDESVVSEDDWESGSIVDDEDEERNLRQEYIDTIQDTLTEVNITDYLDPEKVEDPAAWLIEGIVDFELDALKDLSEMDEDELYNFFVDDMKNNYYK